MTNYHLPRGMRYTKLEERRDFYVQQFDLRRVTDWTKMTRGRIAYAVIIGRHTGIYPEKYKEDANTTVIIDEYRDLNDLRDQIVEFLPEAVYYDRNVYDNKGRRKGQELAFDLDPENITCPIHGNLADKMKRGQGLGFCKLELEKIEEQVVDLYEHLAGQFSKIQVVYSGRGFHIHIFDPEAYSFDERKRTEIARSVKERGFAIDEWVTAGEMRLIRLPYSLNGLVSRIVLPLAKKELEKFDPVHDKRCIPDFLDRQKVTS
jgi:DNA primase catalytic subunit